MLCGTSYFAFTFSRICMFISFYNYFIKLYCVKERMNFNLQSCFHQLHLMFYILNIIVAQINISLYYYDRNERMNFVVIFTQLHLSLLRLHFTFLCFEIDIYLIFIYTKFEISIHITFLSCVLKEFTLENGTLLFEVFLRCLSRQSYEKISVASSCYNYSLN